MHIQQRGRLPAFPVLDLVCLCICVCTPGYILYSCMCVRRCCALFRILRWRCVIREESLLPSSTWIRSTPCMIIRTHSDWMKALWSNCLLVLLTDTKINRVFVCILTQKIKNDPFRGRVWHYLARIYASARFTCTINMCVCNNIRS